MSRSAQALAHGVLTDAAFLDFCNGNNRFFYLNSGFTNLRVVSFADNNNIYFNNQPRRVARINVGAYSVAEVLDK